MEFDELSNQVIGCAIEVHCILGPGLLEETYKQCLAHELHTQGLHVGVEVPLPVKYKAIKLNCGYRLDLFVENALVIELKAVDRLSPIHQAQLITYLKLSGTKTGLLINFNVQKLKEGIKRFVV